MNKEYLGARIKLTILYSGIILIILSLFSFIILSNQNNQFREFEHFKEMVESDQDPLPPPYQQNIDRIQKLIDDVKFNTFINVVVLDTLLLLLSVALSYYLSGQTLQPIINSFNKQKRFVSDASHEFKTPLASIKIEAEVLSRSKKSTLQEYKDFTQSALEEIDALNRLTNNLLELTRFDSDKYINGKKKFDLIDICSKVIKRFKPMLNEKKIKLSFDHKDEEVFVFANPDQVEELISILVDNAIKYNKVDGTIKLRVDNDEKIKMEVSDSGVGIKAENIARVFDRFFRESEDRSEKGFGLGLSIAKEICKRNHISLRVNSEKDKGTTFKLEFNKISN